MNRMTALSLMLTLLFCMPLRAKAAQQDYTLMLATDTHYISPSLTDHGAYFTAMIESGDGKVTAYCEELVRAFVDEVIAIAPNALILSGDLTFNGARKSHEDLARRLAPIREAGIPVYVIPGNHDLNNRSAASFSGGSFTRVEHMTADGFASLYDDFGYGSALSRDAHSLSYIAEVAPDLRLVMLDVNATTIPNIVVTGTFAWLEEQLQDAQRAGARVIAVSHQNVFAHSSLLYHGFMINNAHKLLALYRKYGVSVNLSGHIHMQHTTTDESGFLEIASSSLAVSPCQYGVITVSGDQAAYRSRPVDVGAWAKAQDLTDPNLLDFRQYAAAFFAATTLRQSISAFPGDPQASELATYMANVNAAYFSGRLDTLAPDPDLTARWQAAGTFFSQYLDSILKETPIDHTKADFTL